MIEEQAMTVNNDKPNGRTKGSNKYYPTSCNT